MLELDASHTVQRRGNESENVYSESQFETKKLRKERRK